MQRRHTLLWRSPFELEALNGPAALASRGVDARGEELQLFYGHQADLELRDRQKEEAPEFEHQTGTSAAVITEHRFQEWHKESKLSFKSNDGGFIAKGGIVEQKVGSSIADKTALHLCFLETVAITCSLSVGTSKPLATWEIIDAGRRTVRTHPALNGGATTAGVVSGKHSWQWDGRNDANALVPEGTYRSRITVKGTGAPVVHESPAIIVQGSPYEIFIFGEPKSDGELLAALRAGGRLLNGQGERTVRDAWITVFRGRIDDVHMVFLGQGGIEATQAMGDVRHSKRGAVATPHDRAYKAWVRADPHGQQARPDVVQIEDLGRSDGRIELKHSPGQPCPVNPYVEVGTPNTFKDGVQAHVAAGKQGFTRDDTSQGCTTIAPILGRNCSNPGTQRGAVRSINSDFGTFSRTKGKPAPVFVNKQNKRNFPADALLPDGHADPLLNPAGGKGCGGKPDEPLHMQPTFQQAVFGGFLGNELPDDMSVADNPTNRARIRMTLRGYVKSSVYHQYHHAVAFGHGFEKKGGKLTFTIFVPRKVIRLWNENRRNVLVQGQTQVAWYVVKPGGVRVSLLAGKNPAALTALTDVGLLIGTYVPTPGPHTCVFQYKLAVRPFVRGADAWTPEDQALDRFSTKGAVIAAETSSIFEHQLFFEGRNQLTFVI